MSFVGNLEVLKNEVINEEVFALTLEAHEADIKAGQFYNFKTSDIVYPLLRRPISVALVEDGKIIFYIQKKGTGTQLLSNLKAGDEVNVIGPLGNGFDFTGIKKPLVVGGGIGVAPMMEAARQLKESGHEAVKVLLGYREEPYGIDVFEKITSDIAIASERAEGYHKGYVTALLEEVLDAAVYDGVFVCGPHVMLKAVAAICKAKGVKSHLLMEEKMACGIGACLVCTCKIQKEGESDFKNLRTCKEGPVFPGEEVLFDE
ncbi:MAG: dihydroorotate dehydrogenase electron transfer subunit [Clostridia bacterium]|nr:dihydroorotate dehydrogenase electron transfer subunit [Clostridia bacterium]